MALQTQLGLAYDQAVRELVTVEKKNIVVLTDIARDALRSDPQAAPSLADVIINRILQAPAPQKLPVLYLMDSISKTVGEPYKTLFARALPEVYMSAWQLGGPGLHRSLDKLLLTWAGIFPQHVLDNIHSRMAAVRAAQAPLQIQPASNGYGGGGYGYGYAPVVPAHMQQQQQLVQPPPQQQFMPMAADPRLAQQPLQQRLPPQQQPVYGMQQVQLPVQYEQLPVQYEQQQQRPGYGLQAPAYQQQQAAPVYGYSQQQPQQPQPVYYQQQQQPQQFAAPLQQQQPQQFAAPLQQQEVAPLAQQPQQQQQVSDLLSSLMTAGLLAAPGVQHASATLASGGSGSVLSTPPYAATATPEREQPASTNFTPERIKEHNPSAVSRLLRQTEATKSRFLDRKFLRRQQKAVGAAARNSRLWYVDLDIWMASTVGAAAAAAGTAAAGGGGAGGRGGQQAALATAAAVAQKHSVPVDDSQPHCALSGEQFEQFWDEGHQEWRYKDAKQLDADEAASYGLQQGALVLVSALGKPAASVLQQGADSSGGGGGVLSELHAQHEIAADLAAAAAAAAAAVAMEPAAGGGRGEQEVHQDIKPSLKHLLDEGDEAAAAAAMAAALGGGSGSMQAAAVEALLQPQEKRLRVA